MKKEFSWFAAFTAVFAVCAAFVFWGTWSLDFAPVSPDDAIHWHSSFGETVRACIAKFLSTGKFVPSDVFWDGLFGGRWFCKELKYAVALYCSGVALAWFLLGKGLTRLAAYGAGLFLSFSGYWCTLFSAGHGGWFVWMTYGVFSFGLIDRVLPAGGAPLGAFRSSLKYWMLLGACVAWGSFYQPDLWLLFTVFTGIYFLYRFLAFLSSTAKDDRGKDLLTIAKGVAVAAVVFFAVGAPSFYSAFVVDLASRDQQIEGSGSNGTTESPKSAQEKSEERWVFVTNWSLPPDEIAEAMFPRINGDTSCVLTQSLGAKAGIGVEPYTGAIGRPLNATKGNFRQHSLYIGFVTCLFAIFSVVMMLVNFRSSDLKSRNRTVLFFAASALVFFVLACGRYCEPVYRIIYMLPFGDYLRAPVKWYHLAEFCVVILAGFGIDDLLRFLRTPDFESRGFKSMDFKYLAVAAVILVGTFDLARVDHKFCAPVDYSTAKQKNCTMDMTVLHKSQFNDTQISYMVNRGLIKSLAYYSGRNDMYLVGILKQREKKPDAPLPPWGMPSTLGAISLVASLAVAGVFLRLKR